LRGGRCFQLSFFLVVVLGSSSSIDLFFDTWSLDRRGLVEFANSYLSSEPDLALRDWCGENNVGIVVPRRRRVQFARRQTRSWRAYRLGCRQGPNLNDHFPKISDNVCEACFQGAKRKDSLPFLTAFRRPEEQRTLVGADARLTWVASVSERRPEQAAPPVCLAPAKMKMKISTTGKKTFFYRYFDQMSERKNLDRGTPAHLSIASRCRPRGNVDGRRRARWSRPAIGSSSDTLTCVTASQTPRWRYPPPSRVVTGGAHDL
jgi:hypothetical protein